jgi:hypothetical protein
MKLQQSRSLCVLGGLTAVCMSAALICACGGGGSDSTDTTSDATSSTSNVFKDLVGTYTVACRNDVDVPNSSVNISSQGSVSVTQLVGSDRANVTLHALLYSSPASDISGTQCADAALDLDLTVAGQIRDLGKTKNVVTADGTHKVAKVVEFTFSGFTLGKGSIGGSVPALNTTTQIGYVFDGSKLYLGSGTRDADGIASSLHSRYGVKQ